MAKMKKTNDPMLMAMTRTKKKARPIPSPVPSAMGIVASA
jgi:hypothetical protein